MPNFPSLKAKTREQSKRHCWVFSPSFILSEATFSRALQVSRCSSPSLPLRRRRTCSNSSRASWWRPMRSRTAARLLRMTDSLRGDHRRNSRLFCSALAQRSRLPWRSLSSQRHLAQLMSAASYSSSSSSLRPEPSRASSSSTKDLQQSAARAQFSLARHSSAASRCRQITRLGVEAACSIAVIFSSSSMSWRDLRETSFQGRLGTLLGGRRGSLALATLLSLPVSCSSALAIHCILSSLRRIPTFSCSCSQADRWMPMQKRSCLPSRLVLMKMGEPLCPGLVVKRQAILPVSSLTWKLPFVPHCSSLIPSSSTWQNSLAGQPNTLISVVLLVQFSSNLMFSSLRGVARRRRQRSQSSWLGSVMQAGCTLYCSTLQQLPSVFWFRINSSFPASPCSLVPGQNSSHSAHCTCLNSSSASSAVSARVVWAVEPSVAEMEDCRCFLYFLKRSLLISQTLWATVSTRSSLMITPVPMWGPWFERNFPRMSPMNGSAFYSCDRT